MLSVIMAQTAGEQSQAAAKPHTEPTDLGTNPPTDC